MSTCPSCAAALPIGARFCPSCAAPLGQIGPASAAGEDAPSDADVTVLPAPTGGGPLSPAGALSGDAPRVYPAGTMLAQRYRIVGLLGRGGMGEVYRADDLTLGQPVALKFVSRELAGDGARFARFLDEARSARQVAHANVCRVYDVGETDDPMGHGPARRFLTMEYVDGEDLATSVRRIGRFPADKGLEIARQLCAGLGAVHERGLLHRDLKPANVMLDGRGRVRLTDFGLAGEAVRAGEPHERAGTPAYMAPELLRGDPASVASDIYALGLVLYEVFTGRRAFDATTVLDLRELQERSKPPALSSSVGYIDPAIEEVVFRCLDPQPARRPSSAIAVAAALPGGDPLAAALAAGETPSPAMVAAAGENQGLQVRAAVAWLAAFFLLLATVVGLIAFDGFTRHVPFNVPPDVLANDAEDVLALCGFDGRPADRAYFFYWHTDYTQFVNATRKETDRWRPMRDGYEPGALFFYRAADAPLVAQSFGGGGLRVGQVGTSDPPPVRAGDRRVWLDTGGRLLRLEVVPPQVDVSAASGTTEPPPDWRALFAAARLEPARFSEARPEWVPLSAFDQRTAWVGTLAARPDTPLRVEAASWRGRPVFFRVVAPWTRPERQRAPVVSAGQRVANVVGISVFLVLVAGAILLARHTASQGRADLRGATRLAAFVAGLSMAGWVLSADHVATTDELGLVITGAAAALVTAGAAWVLYVALEPFVRRRWPHTVITWNRLLAGRYRDGLFGRDLLIGSVVGLGLAVLFFVHLALGRLLGPYDPEPLTPVLQPLLGTRHIGAAFVSLLSSSILASLQIFGLAFLGLLIFRRAWAAALALLVIVALQTAGTGNPVAGIGYQVVMMGSLLWLLFRYGLVAFAVAGFVLSTVGGGFPMSVDPAHWSTGASVAVLAGLAVAAVFGFRLALGSQRILGSAIDG